MDDLERFIRYHVTPDDVVVDIGANQGIYTKMFSQLAKTVYCLEPNPTIFALLKKNVPGANVHPLQMAASDRTGEIDFYLDKRPEMGGVASSVNVLDGMGGAVEKVSVKATTIDRLCEDFGIVPTFIKADVEGHEPALFRGARETIKRHQPLLVFEFWESWWDNGFSDLFAELEQSYHLVRIQDGANASHAYRMGRGDKTVDIAALPRRLAGRNWPAPPARRWARGAVAAARARFKFARSQAARRS